MSNEQRELRNATLAVNRYVNYLARCVNTPGGSINAFDVSRLASRVNRRVRAYDARHRVGMHYEISPAITETHTR